MPQIERENGIALLYYLPTTFVTEALVYLIPRCLLGLFSVAFLIQCIPVYLIQGPASTSPLFFI